jgi:hypothetical protein
VKNKTEQHEQIAKTDISLELTGLQTIHGGHRASLPHLIENKKLDLVHGTTRRSPSYRPVHFQLASDATSVMMPRAPPTIAPPPVWETLARLAFTLSKLLDLDACPTPTSLRRFYGATNKPKPA